jgi:hypothetical protein
MEITINLDTLTPQQAFEIGFQLRQRPAYEPLPKVEAIPVVAEPSTRKAIRKQRTATSPSNKWRFNTSISRDIIAAIVQAKFEGATLLQIANDLNSLGYKSVSGKPWSDQMVWSVAYSKQAKSAWKALGAVNA